MTLISHKYKFIYLKTLKTASTTVQHYFTKQLLKEHPLAYEKVLKGIEYEDNELIIGFRAYNRAKRWYSHMPAYQVKLELDKIDPSIWETYFKFTTIRNPFDYCVSHYCFVLNEANRVFHNKVLFSSLRIIRNNPKLLFKAFLQNFHDYWKLRKKRNMSFEYYLKEVKLKREKTSPHRNNWIIYTIDDQPICDYYIKQEKLVDGIRAVSEKIGLSFVPEEIGRFVVSNRSQNDTYHKYYTKELIELVQEEYKKELELFDYEF